MMHCFVANRFLTSERIFIMGDKLEQAEKAAAAANAFVIEVREGYAKSKIEDVNNLITRYHIRKSQLSKKAQKILATRKAKTKTKNVGKPKKKKASKKSGKKRIAVSKQATANTAA